MKTNPSSWQSTPPTVPGIYWMRRKDKGMALENEPPDDKVWIAEIVENPTIGWLQAHLTNGSINTALNQYEWAGPLSPPSE